MNAIAIPWVYRAIAVFGAAWACSASRPPASAFDEGASDPRSVEEQIVADMVAVRVIGSHDLGCDGERLVIEDVSVRDADQYAVRGCGAEASYRIHDTTGLAGNREVVMFSRSTLAIP